MKKNQVTPNNSPAAPGGSQGPLPGDKAPEPQTPGDAQPAPVPIAEASGQPDADGIPVWCAFNRIIRTEVLKPNPRNPNQHPEAQIKLFGKILRANGWRRAIVVSNRSGFITKGHGAWLTAIAERLKFVPVNYQDYPTAEAELEDLVADNELARLATTNDAQLKEILKDLQKAGEDLELTGILKDLQKAGEDLELTGILKRLEDKPTLKEIEIKAPPKMAWVLIAVPLVKFAAVNQTIEKLALDPDVFVESCVSDKEPEC